MTVLPPCTRNPIDTLDTPGPRALPPRCPGLGPGCPGWLRNKGWRVVLPIAAVLLAACAGPRLEPLPRMTVSAPGVAVDRCAALFPQGRWQMTHAIEFRLADGASGNALGVLILDGQNLDCALTTVEGLTLFEARSQGDGSLEVLRALPPFDNPEFARGLLRDVRTLMQPPPGLGRYGTLADGTPVCRYDAGQTITDILPQADGCWQLFTYDEQRILRTDGCQPADPRREHRQTRAVAAHSCERIGGAVLPRRLDLRGFAPSAYTLNLRLLSAEPLPAATP